MEGRPKAAKMCSTRSHMVGCQALSTVPWCAGSCYSGGPEPSSSCYGDQSREWWELYLACSSGTIVQDSGKGLALSLLASSGEQAIGLQHSCISVFEIHLGMARLPSSYHVQVDTGIRCQALWRLTPYLVRHRSSTSSSWTPENCVRLDHIAWSHDVDRRTDWVCKRLGEDGSVTARPKTCRR